MLRAIFAGMANGCRAFIASTASQRNSFLLISALLYFYYRTGTGAGLTSTAGTSSTKKVRRAVQGMYGRRRCPRRLYFVRADPVCTFVPGIQQTRTTGSTSTGTSTIVKCEIKWV